MEGLFKVALGVFLLGIGVVATKEGWKDIQKGLR